VDKTGNRVFGTHPSGTYRGFKATAQGAGRETVLSILKEDYRENMKLQETTKLAVKCLAKALEARQLPPRMKITVIPSDTKKLEVLSDDKIESYVKELGAGK
jgi:proteasome alpha subunit